jgi:hypothetical protein
MYSERSVKLLVAVQMDLSLVSQDVKSCYRFGVNRTNSRRAAGQMLCCYRPVMLFYNSMPANHSEGRFYTSSNVESSFQ